jgi:predicted CoA-binding protein
MQKVTLVIGATPNPERYAYKATVMLAEYGHPVIPYGIKKGEIQGKSIVNELPQSDVDTVTLYVGPQNQGPFYEYVLALKPKRVVFNPGTENEQWEAQLKEAGIEPIEACTLVMLRTNQY